MDFSHDEFPKTNEGAGADRGVVSVVWGGQGRGPVSQEVLLPPHFQSYKGGDDRGNGREVVLLVEGDGG